MRFTIFSLLLLFVLQFSFIPSTACPSHQSEPVFYAQYPPAAPRTRSSQIRRIKYSNPSSTATGHANLILSRVQAIHSSVRSVPSTAIHSPSNSVTHAQFILNRVGSIHQQVNKQQNTQQQQASTNNNSSQPDSQQNPDENNQDSSPKEEKKGAPIAVIVSVVIVGLVVLLVVIGFILWRFCRSSSSASEDSDSLYYKFDYNSTSLASGAGDDQDHRSGMYMEDEETGAGYPQKTSKKKKGATTANASFVSTEDQIAAPRIDEDEVPSSGVAFLDTYGRPIAEPIMKS